jgi:hypothetical protein
MGAACEMYRIFNELTVHLFTFETKLFTIVDKKVFWKIIHLQSIEELLHLNLQYLEIYKIESDKIISIQTKYLSII